MMKVFATFAVTLSIVAGVLFFATPVTSDERPSVKIANDNRDVHFTYALLPTLAKVWGIFEENDVNVGFLDTSYTGWECAALKSGSAQFGVHLYVVKGCPDDVVVVAALSNSAPYYLVVREGAKNARGKEIVSIADLGGVMLLAYGCGTNGVGLAGRQFLDMIEETGQLSYSCPTPPDAKDLDPNAVYVVEAGGSGGGQQANIILRDKRLAGGLMLAKYVRTLFNSGERFKILAGPAEFNAENRRVPISLLVTTRTFNEKHRDVVERVVASLRAAHERALENPDETKEIVATLFAPNSSREDAEFFYNTFISLTPTQLCVEEDDIKMAVRFYALKNEEEMPLHGTVDLVGCGK